MRVCVYGAASNNINPEFLSEGELLGSALAKKGISVVYGGGASGLMGAVARGAYKEKGELIAVVPSFFNVDGVLFEHSTETIFTETMRTRKQKMEELSDAFIITPGGIGTFDEFFEILTLRSLNRHNKPILILNTLGYYDSMISMLERGKEEGFITKALDFLFVSDSVEEIVKHL